MSGGGEKLDHVCLLFQLDERGFLRWETPGAWGMGAQLFVFVSDAYVAVLFVSAT